LSNQLTIQKVITKVWHSFVISKW